MKKSIVITSIFNPTVAVRKFSKMSGFELIVIGDKKTPTNWNCEKTKYFSIEKQEKLDFDLVKVLPYNHYCRKMIGYLVAIKEGAEYIIDTDDDNIPKENWGFPKFKGKFDTLEDNEGFVNVYQLFTDQKIWPRGLPLNLISKEFNLERKLQKNNCKVGIWQGLADEDPDVDAIYRLTNDTECNFNLREPVVLSKGTISPFNTQNTIIRKELFSLMYLPTYVTFRFTDILRGLVAQPIMWLYGYQLGFTGATVIQRRNPHDYFKDFISEIPMYEYGEKIIDLVSSVVSESKDIIENIYNAYYSIVKEKIIPKEEMKVLESWLKDIKNFV